MNQSISIADQAQVERSFLTRTFLWMTFGLLLTAVVAFVVASSEALLGLIFGNPLITLGLLIAQLAAVFTLSIAVNRMAPAIAMLLFLGYAALTGLTFSVVLLRYTPDSVASTFVVTAGMFGILSIIGMSTQVDLTGLGTLALVGLIGVILMSVVNMFLGSELLYWLISVVGVIIFVVLIARDAQRLKRMATEVDPNTEQGARASILGALALYLDFINLFLFLLRFTGRRN